MPHPHGCGYDFLSDCDRKSEPEIGVDSASHWQRVQMGHSAANIIPVIAANRIGEEVGESCTLTFYGSSFITDHTGEKVAEASRDREEILYSEFDPAIYSRTSPLLGIGS
jgi:N-carbamoylputrescine amidase